MYPTANADWDWYKQQMQLGREIVTAIEPDAMNTPDFFQAWLYRKDQALMVASRGRCEGCGPEELKTCAGRIVCRRTLEICPRQQLTVLVSFYEGVFDECNSNNSNCEE